MGTRARGKKGQAAIEFLMTYGWAIVLMLSFVAVLYYMGMFDSSRMEPRRCVLPSGFSCTSYKMMKNDSIHVLFTGFNGLDYDIGFDNLTAVMAAENLGGMGRNNYSGTCSPAIVKKGQRYTCKFNISDTARVPAVGDQRTLSFVVIYKNCATNPSYSSSMNYSAARTNCNATSTQNHSVVGEIVTQMEQYSSVGGSEYCGNGQCDDNFGETNATCPADCAPRVAYVQLTTNVSKIPANGTSTALLIATVYDQFGSPLNGQNVNFTKNGTGSGSISPASNSTNASGIATSVLTSVASTMNVMINATANTTSVYRIVRYSNST